MVRQVRGAILPLSYYLNRCSASTPMSLFSLVPNASCLSAPETFLSNSHIV
jgi:hypothetical protein